MLTAIVEAVLDGIVFVVGLVGARLLLFIFFLALAILAYLTGAFTAAAICLTLSLIFATWLYLKPPSSIIED